MDKGISHKDESLFNPCQVFTRKSFHALALLVSILCPKVSHALFIDIYSGGWELGSGWGASCTDAACNGEGDINGRFPVAGNHTLLNMDWSIDSGLAQSFEIGFGETKTFLFGQGIFKDEDGTLALAETDNLFIKALLDLSIGSNFESPGVIGTAVGALNDASQDLWITFAPISLDLVDLGLLTIDFTDPSWTCNPGNQGCNYSNQQTRSIWASFTLDRQLNSTSVPEPASLLLMLIGCFILFSTQMILRNREIV